MSRRKATPEFVALQSKEIVMRWGKTFDKSFGWHWWFAWRPVRMTDGRWAWLEGVSRVRVSGLPIQESMFHRFNYRWWEDHVRAKMEDTDDPAIKLTPADLPDEYRCKIVEVE